MSVTSTEVPAPSFVGFIHEGVPVADLEASLKFYTQVLGLKVLPRPNIPIAGAWLGDENKSVQFHLILSERDYKPGADAKVSPTGRHTAWMVRSLDVLRAKLRSLGLTYEEAKGFVASDQVFVKDPDGHTWEFQEPKQS